MLSDGWNSFATKKWPNLFVRLAVLMLGYAFVSLAIALSRSTNLGVSPISAIPNVLSFAAPALTIGQWTFLISVLFVILQWALLRGKFSKIQFLQLPLSLVFSAMIDLFVPIAEMVPQTTYASHVVVTLLSIPIMAVGVFLEVRARLIPLPGEGIGTAINAVTGLTFPQCRLITDIGNVTIGVIISLVTMGGLVGVREGTVILAALVGPAVGVVNKVIPDFERIAPTVGLWELQEGGF